MLETKRGPLPKCLGTTKIKISVHNIDQFVGIKVIDTTVYCAIFNQDGMSVKELGAVLPNSDLFCAWVAAYNLTTGVLGTCTSVDDAMELLRSVLDPQTTSITLENPDGNSEI